MTIKQRITGFGAVLAALCATSAPALAHHVMGGKLPVTFTQGFLSGIGHPILGFDHLFFVALVGIASIYTGNRFVAPLAYIGAMLVGCLCTAFGFKLPVIEAVIGLSLLALGAFVMSGRALSMNMALTAFALAGLFHGSAFGESIVGAEGAAPAASLIGYLVGLAATQYAIALASGWVALSVWKATEATAVQARIAGGIVAGVGLFLTLERAEGLVMVALGMSS